jgi:hypothetical protein
LDEFNHGKFSNSIGAVQNGPARREMTLPAGFHKVWVRANPVSSAPLFGLYEAVPTLTSGEFKLNTFIPGRLKFFAEVAGFGI